VSEVPGDSTSDCLFCRIVARQIPAEIVAESERSVAFRDINPQVPTHVLVVPRRHIDDASSVVASDADDIVDLLLVAQQVSRSEQIAESGYRLIMNVGKDAQNSVGHLHLHVLGGAPLRGSLG
jgi:histidine triad (HIT) family protein